MSTTFYKCKRCRSLFCFEEDEIEDADEVLWGHLRKKHPIIDRRVQDMESPDMISECFENKRGR